MIYDLIIIGSGPAGLTAAIYAMRAKLNTLVIEESGASGGQVLTTYEVDNYPALPGIGGFELGTKMREHADKMGASFVDATVMELINEGKTKKVVTGNETYETRSVIIATGASHAKLNIPGEETLAGMGVSYCATCDGAFFKNRTTAVVGGGDVAVEDAIFLSRLCKKVYLIHRRDSLRAAQILQDNLREIHNIEVIWDSVVTQIQGEEQVEKLIVKNVKKEETSELPVDGIFIAVGIHPNTARFQPLLKTDKAGYITADETGVTNVPGIFVAGDARTKQLRQIVTAVSDGANAVTSVQQYFIS
ncbi:MAG: thioredoxin-disulfide reductase [Lachnospiraceae bacterium]|nr:thioredoxin-disulfide reductase [Lachnospiraceae bacterium]